MDIIDSLQAADWELHFACAAQPSEHSIDLSGTRSIACHQIPLNSSEFDRWVGELAPQIVIFDRFMTEEQFGWRVEKAAPEALRILDTSDLHCLRAARQRSLNTGEPVDLFNDTALREIASIHRCDLTLMISEYECQVLRESFSIPKGQFAYWPFLLPEPVVNPPAFENRTHCVMIGSFMHEPNWDAVRWTRESIWPLVRKALPEVELHVYGSYVPPKAMQLDSPKLGFRVKGRADDAVETLLLYRLNLAPLRFGAGLKGKLADAFRSGTPSIATTIAIEGMNGSIPWGSPVRDDPPGFARAVVDLYNEPSAWLQAQASGYTIAKERFNKEHWLPMLARYLLDAYSARRENRHQRFVGRLLRHHQHRSLEYMSRWIEAKNAAAEGNRDAPTNC